MPLLALVVVLLIPFAVIALMPLILIQRFRLGRARRLARPWIANVNVIAMSLSVAFFLVTAALTSVWAAGALTAALAGLSLGCVLGMIGLRLSRWEPGPRTLYYTPNQWLVLAMTLTVAARVLYGFWRSWMWWAGNSSAESLLAAFGIAGSLGAAAVVLGYYLVYSIGVRRRIRLHARSTHPRASAIPAR
jgi:hypothetical protein